LIHRRFEETSRACKKGVRKKGAGFIF